MLLRDIRIMGAARRIEEMQTARPDATLQLPAQSVVGGFRRRRCTACSSVVWHHITSHPESGSMCGSCIKIGCPKVCMICFETCRPFAISQQCMDLATHQFCTTCIGKYVSCQVGDGICHIACPAQGCTERITESHVKKLRKVNAISETTLERHKYLKNQDRAQRLRDIFTSEPPAFLEWARSHLQACPHCYVLVEKNQGCNHITCKCAGTFCWICGRDDSKGSHQECRTAKNPRLNAHGLVEPSAQQPVATTTELGSSSTSSNATRAAPATAERTLEAARAHIVSAATLKCPNRLCQAPVCMDTDFDSCFSLQCSACSSHFCAWCFRLSPDGEDPHSHVLDCTSAPDALRGSALYLHDGNGGPHVPPNPARAFDAHWESKLRERARAAVEELRAKGFDPEILAALSETKHYVLRQLSWGEQGAPRTSEGA